MIQLAIFYLSISPNQLNISAAPELQIHSFGAKELYDAK